MPDKTEDTAEVKDKAERQTKAMWVPWGVISFADLDVAEVAQESAEKMHELAWNFQDLTWNILNSDEVVDKGAAVKVLAGEFADRIGAVTNIKVKSIIKTDLKHLSGGVKEKLAHVMRKAVGVESPERNVVIYKDQGGAYRFVGRYSNCYRDDDNPPEIISEKSHKTFVKLVDEGLVPQPELWIWHSKATHIGQADWVAYDDSGFALAGGYIKPEFSDLAENLKELDDMAMSHGMPKWSIERDEKDKSVITQHITEEISLLPGWAAANKRTGFAILDSSIKGTNEDIMAIPVEKRQELVDWGIEPGLIDALETQNAKQAAEADLAAVERKEETATEPVEAETGEETAEVPVEAEEAAPETETDEVAQPTALIAAMQETMKAILVVSERLEGIEKEVKELQRSDAEKVAKKAASTSLASMTDILRSTVIGSEAARVDGRKSLAKDGPEETKPEPVTRTGIPMIDGWLTPAQ